MAALFVHVLGNAVTKLMRLLNEFEGVEGIGPPPAVPTGSKKTKKPAEQSRSLPPSVFAARSTVDALRVEYLLSLAAPSTVARRCRHPPAQTTRIPLGRLHSDLRSSLRRPP